jgi:flavodoxin
MRAALPAIQHRHGASARTSESEMKKILIAYYSRRGENYVNGDIVDLPVGNTEVAAGTIRKLTGGEMFRIDTVKKYPDDYHATTRVAQEELRRGARPALTDHVDDLATYDVIILGYPTGGGRCRWRCSRSSSSTTCRAGRSFRSARTRVAGWGTASATSASCVRVPPSLQGWRSAAGASPRLRARSRGGLGLWA